MTHVLIGEFDTIVDIGLRHVLAEEGCEVATHTRELTSSVINRISPDAVVVDLDDDAVTTSAERLIADYPGLPIVEMSSSTPRLRVFPAYRFGKSYDVPLSVESLITAVTGP